MKRMRDSAVDDETEYWLVNRHRVQWRWKWLQLRLSQLQNVPQAVLSGDQSSNTELNVSDAYRPLLQNHPMGSLALLNPNETDVDELKHRMIQKRRRQAEHRQLIKPGGVALDFDKKINVVHVEAMEQAAGFTESNRENTGNKRAIVIPGIVIVGDRHSDEEDDECDSDEGGLDQLENTDDVQYARMHMVREVQEQAVRESWGRRKKFVIKKRGEVTAQELLYSPMLSSRLPKGVKVPKAVVPKKRAEEIEAKAQKLKQSYVNEQEGYVRYQLHKSFSADVIKPKGKGIAVLKFKVGKKKKPE